MSAGTMASVGIGMVTLAVLFILFGGSGGGGAMADDLRDRLGSFGESDRGTGDGMNYQKHERIYEADDNWWKSHRAAHRGAIQFGDPNECTSKGTWSARCNYHR